eukprot:9906411-Alexandrium_andersonii.AAC.1
MQPPAFAHLLQGSRRPTRYQDVAARPLVGRNADDQFRTNAAAAYPSGMRRVITKAIVARGRRALPPMRPRGDGQ